MSRYISIAYAADAKLAEIHLLVEEGLRVRRREVRQLAEPRHVHPRLEHDKDVRHIVVRDLLRVGAHVEAGRAVRAPQPHAADLVTVDVAQRLTVQDVLEISGRVVRRRRSCGNLAHLVLVLDVSYIDDFMTKGKAQAWR